MKKLTIILNIAMLALGITYAQKHEMKTFKDVFKGKFYVGAALNEAQIMGRDTQSLAIVLKQFNTITPENHMKAAIIHPEKDKYNFTVADKYVEFGLKHKMKIIGHTLIWHSQLPKWFFKDDNGNWIDKEELKKRMKDHISTVVGRYKGKINGWDVVNEAIDDNGEYRKSPFYEIMGEEYIKLAFQFAHEADPKAELYYNDYSMPNHKKRAKVVEMLKMLQAAGIKVDGQGMQGHYSSRDEDPKIEDVEQAIKDFTALGLKVMFTELDLSVLPFPYNTGGADISKTADYEEKYNPYTKGMTPEAQAQLNKRYLELFKLFLKYEDKIDRITFWGVTDRHSWKNNWPVRGRTDYPLLFDRNYQPKPVVEDIFKLVKK